MFEQSVLPNSTGSQRWGLLFSLTGELVVLGILLIIPLAWTDRLPHLDWRTPTRIGPPPPARPAVHSANHASARPNTHLPIFRLTPVHLSGQPPQHVEFDAPSESIGVAGGMETTTNTFTPVVPVIKLAPPPEKPKVEEPKPSPRSIAVSQGAQLAKLIRQVKPIYPLIAKQTHVSGTVQLVGIISKDGTIRNLQVISGHPLLVRAAMEAVSQWVYRPTLLNGEPVEVTAPIEVNFILTQ